MRETLRDVRLRERLAVVEVAKRMGVPLGPYVEAEARSTCGFPDAQVIDTITFHVMDFLYDRLLVLSQGARHDVLAAAFAAACDDDITRLLARTDAVAALLRSDDGANLLTAYRRAANILRIEDRKDGPHAGEPDRDLLRVPEEIVLAQSLRVTESTVIPLLEREDFAAAMAAMAQLRAPLDTFFDKVTVNAPEPDLRRNRLRLLHSLRSTMGRIADFAKIEG